MEFERAKTQKQKKVRLGPGAREKSQNIEVSRKSSHSLFSNFDQSKRVTTDIYCDRTGNKVEAVLHKSALNYCSVDLDKRRRF